MTTHQWIQKGVLIAQSLIVDEAAPDASRRMAPYFDPPPGTLVSVDRDELQSLGSARALEARGRIRIRNLPRDTCLAIQLSEDRPAERVCRDQVLAFRASDLNIAGEVVWRVGIAKSSEEETPFKAVLSWPTPHRLAQVIPEGRVPPSLSLPVFVESCKRGEGRALLLHTWDKNRKWTFRLPEADLLAKQPKKSPNLFQQTEKGGLKGAKDRQAQAAAEGAGEEGGAGAGETAGDDRPKIIPTEERRKLSSDPTLYWVVPARNSYLLPASSVIIEDAPPGQRGVCHYRLSGAPDDPQSGIIECHHVAGYDVIITHLACAQEFLSDR